MPKYVPVPIPCALKCTYSDILEIQFKVNGVRATFIIPERPEAALEVTVAGAAIVRLVDEMPLSTEEDDSPNEGLVADHFAYRVEGAAFFRMQSESWKAIHAPCAHYRFITGWTCLDVVTKTEPQFAIVVRSDGAG